MISDNDPPKDRELFKTFGCLALILAASIAIAFSFPAKADTETRDVGAFDTIELKGGAKLKIAIAEKTSLKVEGDKDTLKHTTTEITGGKLVIDNRSDRSLFHHTSDGPTVTVTLPRLAELVLSGGADVDIDGLAGGASKLSISGAGHVKGHGHLDVIEVTINGAGEVDYGEVSTEDATAVVNGVGHIKVQSHRSLLATVNGVGSVDYSGNPPKVESAIHGVGSIARSGTGWE